MTTDTTAIRDILDRYTEAQHMMQDGCSDGYCVVRRPRGMHTNGGCRCLYKPDHLTTQRAGHIMRLAQEMEIAILALCDEVERLRAENERLREAAEHFATWDQCWPGNINLEVACKKIRAALTQKGE